MGVFPCVYVCVCMRVCVCTVHEQSGGVAQRWQLHGLIPFGEGRGASPRCHGDLPALTEVYSDRCLVSVSCLSLTLSTRLTDGPALPLMVPADLRESYSVVLIIHCYCWVAGVRMYLSVCVSVSVCLCVCHLIIFTH